MARPRSFDTDSVLSSVMTLFWHKGYEATSIRDLEQVSGLTAPSLYGAFGNKEALFTAALQHYVDTVIVPAIEASATLGLAGISAMFTSIADKDPELPRGCLLAVTRRPAPGSTGTRLGSPQNGAAGRPLFRDRRRVARPDDRSGVHRGCLSRAPPRHPDPVPLITRPRRRPRYRRTGARSPPAAPAPTGDEDAGQIADATGPLTPIVDCLPPVKPAPRPPRAPASVVAVQGKQWWA
jgi:AcrR family transcriptional regulator